MLILERYVNPSKHVLEPYGTVCRNGNEYFIQVSKDKESANWITLGELLWVHFGSSLSDDLIQQCLKSYENKNINPE